MQIFSICNKEIAKLLINTETDSQLSRNYTYVIAIILFLPSVGNELEEVCINCNLIQC